MLIEKKDISSAQKKDIDNREMPVEGKANHNGMPGLLNAYTGKAISIFMIIAI